MHNSAFHMRGAIEMHIFGTNETNDLAIDMHNIAFNIARAHKQGERADGTHGTIEGGVVGFFSLEMSAEQLAARILSEAAEVPSERIRSGNMDEGEFRRFVEAAHALQNCPLYIDDTPALPINQLAARARKLKRVHGLDVLMVDYLQLLKAASAKDSRVNEVSEITQGLKAVAKELNIPVIALSQLSRQVENREDKRPQLSDLRESGSIEQDADMVWFIFRAEYYHNALKPDTPDETSSEEVRMKYAEWEARHLELVNKATLIVAKQRHGSAGNVPLLFHSEFTKFSSPEIRHYEDYE